jgi:hypothetical protein
MLWKALQKTIGTALYYIKIRVAVAFRRTPEGHQVASAKSANIAKIVEIEGFLREIGQISFGVKD